MIDEAQLLALLADRESFRVERTVSTADTAKFSEKVLGFVNRFGRGVDRAQAPLVMNGSSSAKFEFGDTFFAVTLGARP